MSELNPKNVQAYLTKRYADELDAGLACHVEGEELVMQMTQPAE